MLEPRGRPQVKNGREDVYLYATPRFDQACLYAAPFPEQGGVMITLAPDQRSPLVMIAFCAASDYLSQPVDGVVYKLATEPFAPVLSRANNKYSREWVSPEPVMPHRVAQRVTSFDQIMATGVQIVTLETIDGREMFLRDGPLSMVERLALVFNEGARWINEERNICPNRHLGRVLKPL